MRCQISIPVDGCAGNKTLLGYVQTTSSLVVLNCCVLFRIGYLSSIPLPFPILKVFASFLGCKIIACESQDLSCDHVDGRIGDAEIILFLHSINFNLHSAFFDRFGADPVPMTSSSIAGEVRTRIGCLDEHSPLL